MTFVRPEILRPPSERQSYFLPLTSGCSNNTCTFCNYHGVKLQIRELADVKQEIDALSLFLEHGMALPDIPGIVYYIARGWDGRRVFLQDGDALVYPFPELTAALQHLGHKFPALERVGAYATPQDILRRTDEELTALNALKLGILLYMGVESGDEEVLRRVGKGVNHRQMITAGRKVKQAGITLSVTVILGLGGIDGSQQHARQTARILTDIDPDFAGALTLTLMPGTPLYQQASSGDFHPISPFQSLEELRTIIDNSRFSNCFFSSMHASNYLPVRGRLPQDKPRMLGELDAALAEKDPSHLRPEYLRGL